MNLGHADLLIFNLAQYLKDNYKQKNIDHAYCVFNYSILITESNKTMVQEV